MTSLLTKVIYTCLTYWSTVVRSDNAYLPHFSALFDAVLCSENNLKDIQSLLKEMYRVLKTGGVYLMISHGAPDNRVNHIKRYIDVDIDVVPIRKCNLELNTNLYILSLVFCRCFYYCCIYTLLNVEWRVLTPFIIFATAKPELKGVDESDEACYHYMYVLSKNSN